MTTRGYNDYGGKVRPKYGIPTALKVILYLLLNFAAFYENFKPYRIYTLIIEISLIIFLPINRRYIYGFIKFLLLNFPGLFLLFYLAYWSWHVALFYFMDYMQTIFMLSLGSFIFVESTPMKELILFLNKIHIPPRFTFAFSILVQFLPILVKKIHDIIIFQKARGYKVSIFRPFPILIPALLHVIDFSINLSLSLKSRGFDI